MPPKAKAAVETSVNQNQQTSQELNSKNILLIVLGVILAGILMFNWLDRQKSPPGEITPQGQSTQIEENGSQISPIPTKTHTVAAGESLSLISIRYFGTPFRYQELASLNQIADADLIHPGTVLKIPQNGVAGASAINTLKQNIYTVTQGDTLWDIAVRAYGDGFAWAAIAQANRLTDPDLIHAGNKLIIP